VRTHGTHATNVRPSHAESRRACREPRVLRVRVGGGCGTPRENADRPAALSTAGRSGKVRTRCHRGRVGPIRSNARGRHPVGQDLRGSRPAGTPTDLANTSDPTGDHSRHRWKETSVFARTWFERTLRDAGSSIPSRRASRRLVRDLVSLKDLRCSRVHHGYARHLCSRAAARKPDTGMDLSLSRFSVRAANANRTALARTPRDGALDVIQARIGGVVLGHVVRNGWRRRGRRPSMKRARSTNAAGPRGKFSDASLTSAATRSVGRPDQPRERSCGTGPAWQAPCRPSRPSRRR